MSIFKFYMQAVHSRDRLVVSTERNDCEINSAKFKPSSRNEFLYCSFFLDQNIVLILEVLYISFFIYKVDDFVSGFKFKEVVRQS